VNRVKIFRYPRLDIVEFDDLMISRAKTPNYSGEHAGVGFDTAKGTPIRSCPLLLSEASGWGELVAVAFTKRSAGGRRGSRSCQAVIWRMFNRSSRDYKRAEDMGNLKYRRNWAERRMVHC